MRGLHMSYKAVKSIGPSKYVLAVLCSGSQGMSLDEIKPTVIGVPSGRITYLRLNLGKKVDSSSKAEDIHREDYREFIARFYSTVLKDNKESRIYPYRLNEEIINYLTKEPKNFVSKFAAKIIAKCNKPMSDFLARIHSKLGKLVSERRTIQACQEQMSKGQDPSERLDWKRLLNVFRLMAEPTFIETSDMHTASGALEYLSQGIHKLSHSMSAARWWTRTVERLNLYCICNADSEDGLPTFETLTKKLMLSDRDWELTEAQAILGKSLSDSTKSIFSKFLATANFPGSDHALIKQVFDEFITRPLTTQNNTGTSPKTDVLSNTNPSMPTVDTKEEE